MSKMDVAEAEDLRQQLWQIETDIMLGRLSPREVFDAMRKMVDWASESTAEAVKELEYFQKENSRLEDDVSDLEDALGKLEDAATEVTMGLLWDKDDPVTEKSADAMRISLAEACEKYNPNKQRGESLADAIRRLRK